MKRVRKSLNMKGLWLKPSRDCAGTMCQGSQKVPRQSLDIWNTMDVLVLTPFWGTFPFWQILISLSFCWHDYTDHSHPENISFSQRHPTTTWLLFVFFVTNKKYTENFTTWYMKKTYQQFRFESSLLTTPLWRCHFGKFCAFFLGW